MIDKALWKLSQLALALANLVFVTAMAIINWVFSVFETRRPSR